MDGHALPGTYLAGLLEYAVLPYRKYIPKPQGMASFTKGLARIGLNQDTQESVHTFGC